VVDEQKVDTSPEVVAEPSAPKYCEACGARLPWLGDLNIPGPPGEPVALTGDQAARFRAAYLSLFAFWLAHQTAGDMAIADASLKKVGL
jgi:hypothetical protein